MSSSACRRSSGVRSMRSSGVNPCRAKAGGEVGKNEHSAALVVHDRYPFPIIDLRVDWHEAPIAELRSLWDRYEPQMNDFMDRAIRPDLAAPHLTQP